MLACGLAFRSYHQNRSQQNQWAPVEMTVSVTDGSSSRWPGLDRHIQCRSSLWVGLLGFARHSAIASL